MNTIIASLSAAALLTFACAMPAAGDNGVSYFTHDWTSEDIDLGGTCLNELVNMDFHLDAFEQFFETRNGGRHSLVKGYLTITATGQSSGYVWIGKGPYQGPWYNSFNDREEGEVGELSILQILTFVPVGDGPMWNSHSHFHLTVSANGVVSSYVETEKLSCVGK